MRGKSQLSRVYILPGLLPNEARYHKPMTMPGVRAYPQTNYLSLVAYAFLWLRSQANNLSNSHVGISEHHMLYLVPLQPLDTCLG